MGILYCVFGAKYLPYAISAQWALAWFVMANTTQGFMVGLLVAGACGTCCFFMKRVFIGFLFFLVGQIVGLLFWVLVIFSISDNLNVLKAN